MVLTQQQIGQVATQIGNQLEGRTISQTGFTDGQRKLFKEVSDQTNASQNAFAFGRFADSGSQTITPTQTEIERSQSLPADIRGASIQDIERSQTLRRTTPTEIVRQQSLPVGVRETFPEEVEARQTLRPEIGEGGLALTRREAEGFGFEEGAPVLRRKTFEELETEKAQRILDVEGGSPEVVFIPQQQVDEIATSPLQEFLIADVNIPLPTFIGQSTKVSLREAKSGIGILGESTKVSIPTFIGQGTKVSLGFPSRVAGELIPTTRGGVILVGSLATASILAPPIIATGISGGIGILGFRGAIDKSLGIEQRVASGIVGGLGAGGVIVRGIPFAKGFGAKSVKVAPEGFRVIRGVKGGVGEIGLIEAGKGVRVNIDLPKTSPLIKGGFGRRAGGEQRFIGEDQFLATSQRGLFEVGKEIKLEKELFVTPQEPTIKIAETRLSRLALTELFKRPSDVEIGFGVPPTPQIGIVIGGRVARVETETAFRLGTGTELEAIKTIGTIQDITKVGRARIKGQGVDIFTFEVGRGTGKAPTIKTLREISTEGTARISGEGLIGTTFATSLGRTTLTKTIISPTIKTITSTKAITIKTPKVTFPTATRTTRTTSPLTISTGISTFLTPRTTTSSITTTRLIPSISFLKIPTFPFKTIRTKAPRISGGTFGVSIRRRGTFRPIGKGLSLSKAISIGRGRVATTLGATFRITPEKKGATINIPTPKGFRRGRKPFTFIERRGLRLSTRGEVGEIITARRIKT